MAVLTPSPPPQATEAVQSIFRDAHHRALRSPALSKAAGPLQAVEPLQVFTLGLDDLLAKKDLQAAKSTGWIFLVHDGNQTLASAEAVPTGTGDEQVLSALNEGRAVGSTAEAIRTVRGLPEVSKDDFELRLLRVPALYVTALWLHKTAGTGDLVVPLAPSPVDAQIGQAAPASQLIDELRYKAGQANRAAP
ncbi:hypothetical protein [Bradyrhizobium sp. 2S1]|uniref:hypothetical protein n=1 Tax=Bradyrhizobium sp. 2S1 TaxID=1404429 RepID=UPI00140A5C21|nr:hypothetical protein [Bradyrhizobium sp. 2S1]MCK7669416.1 hypothetical protein [Bradyrhizobium sp. 2S1]